MEEKFLTTEALAYALLGAMGHKQNDPLPVEVPLRFIKTFALASFFFGAILTKLSPQTIENELPQLVNLDLNKADKCIDQFEQSIKEGLNTPYECYFKWIDIELNKASKPGRYALSFDATMNIGMRNFIQGHFLEVKNPNGAKSLFETTQPKSNSWDILMENVNIFLQQAGVESAKKDDKQHD